jgi:hypothetical protein
MERDIRELAGRLAARYGRLPAVEAVAMAGSQTYLLPDAESDLDLCVYSRGDVPLNERQIIADDLGRDVEVGNCFWEPGDEWVDVDSGIHMDVMFRRVDWIEAQLERVLDRCEASVGYSTCFWHNVRSSRMLFDRQGWYAALQVKAQRPYPEQLRRAVVAKNYPVLRDNLSSYGHQIDIAVRRNDRVSVNHRVAALLASYFDILFAVNRLPHPGEKRLVQIAEARCTLLPESMKARVEALVGAVSLPEDGLLNAVNALVSGLEILLRAEGLLSAEDMLK